MSTAVLVVNLFLVLLGIVVVKRSVRVVPSGELLVIERLGRFHAVLRPGLHILVPLIDKVARDFSSDEEEVNLPEHVCFTLEGSSIGIKGTLRYTVVDAEKAAYNVSDPAFGLLELAQAGMRDIVSRRTEQELEGDLDLVGLALQEHLRKASAAWGITVGYCTLERTSALSRRA